MPYITKKVKHEKTLQIARFFRDFRVYPRALRVIPRLLCNFLERQSHPLILRLKQCNRKLVR